MTERVEAAARAKNQRSGCLTRTAVAILVALAVVVAIAAGSFLFDHGANAPESAIGAFNVGPANEYPRGNITPFAAEHMFLSRLEDGIFVALYDKSPKQQELHGDCRVRYEEGASLGSLPQLPGFSGGLVEDCGDGGRSVWRADGKFAFGSGYPGVDLDRFDTKIDATGELIIELDSRTCMRSRGVPGIPPFDVTHCGRPR